MQRVNLKRGWQPSIVNFLCFTHTWKRLNKFSEEKKKKSSYHGSKRWFIGLVHSTKSHLLSFWSADWHARVLASEWRRDSEQRFFPLTCLSKSLIFGINVKKRQSMRLILVKCAKFMNFSVSRGCYRIRRSSRTWLLSPLALWEPPTRTPPNFHNFEQ